MSVRRCKTVVVAAVDFGSFSPTGRKLSSFVSNCYCEPSLTISAGHKQRNPPGKTARKYLASSKTNGCFKRWRSEVLIATSPIAWNRANPFRIRFGYLRFFESYCRRSAALVIIKINARQTICEFS